MKKYKIREYHKYGYIDFPDIYDSREEAEDIIREYTIVNEEDGIDYAVREFETSEEEKI